jgi:hypothetical protein
LGWGPVHAVCGRSRSTDSPSCSHAWRNLDFIRTKERARQIGQVQGGEALSVSRRVSDNVERGSTWLYMGKGWVSGEFLFQPACIRFNGNQMMVVNVSGAAVRSQPNLRAQEVKRLQGGETVIPLRKQTNGEGEWLQTEQGWVNSKTLFTAACQQFYRCLSAEWRHDKMRQDSYP